MWSTNASSSSSFLWDPWAICRSHVSDGAVWYTVYVILNRLGYSIRFHQTSSCFPSSTSQPVPSHPPSSRQRTRCRLCSWLGLHRRFPCPSKVQACQQSIQTFWCWGLGVVKWCCLMMFNVCFLKENTFDHVGCLPTKSQLSWARHRFRGFTLSISESFPTPATWMSSSAENTHG